MATNTENQKFLHDAIQSNDIYWVKDILNVKTDVKDFLKNEHEGNSPLHLACRSGYAEIAEVILQAGADVNQPNKFKGQTPLHIAAYKGHVAVVVLLLKHGADANLQAAHGETALWLAIYVRRSGVVQSLVNSGCDLNKHFENGSTALHYACQNGLKDCATHLIEGGCDMDLFDNSGRTALMVAILFYQKDIAKKLIEAGASVNSTSNNGISALHAANYQGSLQIIDLLIRHGHDLNVGAGMGHGTPVHKATVCGQLPAVIRLISAGADLNATNLEKETPLFAALPTDYYENKPSEELVRALITGGCHVNHSNIYGFRVTELALTKKCFDVATILLHADCVLSDIQGHVPSLQEQCPELYQLLEKEVKFTKSLKRLSRLVIRQNLQNEWPYVKVMQSLPLPVSLKSYLLYDDI